MRVRQRRARLAKRIGEELQIARSGHLGVLLAKRSGGRIAGIGEYLAAGGFLRRIQRQKVAPVHIELAAHLEYIRRRSGKCLRHRVHHADVGGDILAFGAVAAGGGLYQCAALIAERQRQPVDFRLGGEGQLVILGKRQEAPDAGGEILDVLVREAVVQRQHGARMPHLAETGRRRRTNAKAGAVLADKRREDGLKRTVARHQRVIVGIADHRRVLAVIAGVVIGDGGGKRFQLVPRRGLVHPVRRHGSGAK